MIAGVNWCKCHRELIEASREIGAVSTSIIVPDIGFECEICEVIESYSEIKGYGNLGRPPFRVRRSKLGPFLGFPEIVGLMRRQIGLIRPRPQDLCQIAQHDRFPGR